MRRVLPVLLALVAVISLAPPFADATSYPGATWYPAASCNYTASNREATYDINTIVIHTAEGSYSGTISWFQNCNAQASSHYVVAKDGRVAAMVRDEDIAWHAGWWDTNTHSIGIEHEGYTYTCCYTQAQYEASAKLTRWLADRYGVPLDRTHIIGHYQVPGCASGNGGGTGCHTDPGPYWDWTHYMALVTSNGADTTPPSTPTVGEDACGPSWTRVATCHWTWSASDPESGIATYEVAPSWSASFTTGAQGWRPTFGTGSYSIRVRAENNVGLWSAWSAPVAVHVDVTPPNAPAIASARAGAWSNDATPTVTWTDPGDLGSGVAAYARTLDGAIGNVGNVLADTPRLADGVHTYSLKAMDGVGWLSASSNGLTLKIDTTPPVTRLVAGSPSVARSDATWVTNATPLALDASDALSGVASTTRDGTPYAGPFTLHGADGPRTVAFASTDVAGNVEPTRSAVLRLDDTAPALSVTGLAEGSVLVTTGEARVEGNASDAGVGLARVEMSIDRELVASSATGAFSFAWRPGDVRAGPHLVAITAVDALGNAATITRNVTSVPTSDAGAQATLAWLAG
ncbi:MAG: N-acetylmuramoyl-L-alanine amidase, partial [Thermoplasmatota archaeon]